MRIKKKKKMWRNTAASLRWIRRFGCQNQPGERGVWIRRFGCHGFRQEGQDGVWYQSSALGRGTAHRFVCSHRATPRYKSTFGNALGKSTSESRWKGVAPKLTTRTSPTSGGTQQPPYPATTVEECGKMGGGTRDAHRFRGGLVFKAHRLCVSLNSRLESNQEKREHQRRAPGRGARSPLLLPTLSRLFPQ